MQAIPYAIRPDNIKDLSACHQKQQIASSKEP
jgi:hypothetical protein